VSQHCSLCGVCLVLVEPDVLGRFLTVTGDNFHSVDFADFGHFSKLDTGDDEGPDVVTKLVI